MARVCLDCNSIDMDYDAGTLRYFCRDCGSFNTEHRNVHNMRRGRRSVIDANDHYEVYDSNHGRYQVPKRGDDD